MNRILILLFNLLFSYTFCQVGNENVSFSTGTFFMRANKSTILDYVVDGKPYLDGDKFHKVVIKDYSKNVQELRYNAYADEMEFKSGEDLYFANKENQLKINFPDLKKTYECLQYSIDGRTFFGYLVVLVDQPKFSLFKKEKVELLKGEKSPSAYTKDANDYYAKQKDVYIIKKGEQFFKFPKNTSELAKIFSLAKQHIDGYIKANNINLSKEDGMIKLVEFVNQQ